MQLSDRQRQAVVAPAGVAISAGAGTGKTQTMAARYVAHVTDGIRPLAMVAVTFTIRAAAELRHRILAQMRERFESNDPRILEVEVAPIGTIHALCQRICIEFPDESGLNYEFQVADETTYNQLVALELPHLLSRVPSSTYDLIDYSTCKAFVTQILGDIASFREALSVDIEKVKEAIRTAQGEAMAASCWAQFQTELISVTSNNPTDMIEQMRRQAIAGLRALDAGDAAGWELLDTLRLRGGARKNWSGQDLDSVKETLRSLRGAVQSLPAYVRLGFTDTDHEHQRILELLAEAVTIVVEELDKLKAERQIVDFDDLETHALRALNHECVRQELARRWKAVLVDEVQDISPIQYEILTNLTAEARLSAVGDAQQSLYRFRGADPSLFARQLATSDARVTLDENYRTVPRLVALVNSTFTSLLPQYDELRPIRTTVHPREPAEILLIDEASELTMSQRRIKLAEAVGHRILSILEDPFVIADPETGALRQAQPRDIAIISASWAMLNGVARELQRLQLPANIVGGGQLLATQEALDALTILAFCVNPHEDLSCLALMRSPMIGISDAELAALATTKDRHRSWFDHLRQTIGHDSRLEPLGQLPYAPTSLTPSDQLAQAADLLLYPELISTLNHPERRHADWIGLLELVDQRSRDGLDAAEVVTFLRTAIAAGARVGRPSIEADNSISLVTIHASKGLEWPIAIVIDLDRKPRAAPQLVVDRNLGVAFAVGEERSGHRSWIVAHHEYEDAAEERRRWYVATTRARDHLILALASTQRVDELVDRIAEQVGSTTIPANQPAAQPRTLASTFLAKYREPPAGLVVPTASVPRTIRSGTLTDFQSCPLLVDLTDPDSSAQRRKAFILDAMVNEGSRDLKNLLWLPKRQRDQMLTAIDQFRLRIGPYLSSLRTLVHGATTLPFLKVQWGPFLNDGASLIDLAYPRGDLVGLSLAHLELPAARAGIYHPADGRIHWLSANELTLISQSLPQLAREFTQNPREPRDGRAMVCRSCQRAPVCHWVQLEDHRL